MENQADIEMRTKDAGAREQSKNAVSLFIFFFQSLIATALLPVVVGRSGGDTGIAVWRLSLLLCSYFYYRVCVLSSATRKGKACLLVRLTRAASMAFAVDAALSHVVGTAIIYLDSVWMACAFGHALAEHSASSSEKAEQRAYQEKLAGELVAIAFLLIMFAAFVLSLACIMHPECAPQVVVAALPLLLCIFLTIAIICALKPSIVAILGVECDTANVFLCSLISPIILYIYSSRGPVVDLRPWLRGALGLLPQPERFLHLQQHRGMALTEEQPQAKMELLNKKQAAAAAGLPEEQADAAGRNKEQTALTVLDKC